MKSRKTKVFKINGLEYRFDELAFKAYVNNVTDRKSGNTQEKLFAELGKQIGESPGAIKNWKYGKNGPGDLDIVKNMASKLGIDYMLLMKKVEGDDTMDKLNDRQIEAAKKIYDKFTWFLEEFYNTDGFTTWWHEYNAAGHRDPDSDVYDRIGKMINEIGLVISQEYFDLHDHEIYDDFNEYLGEDLYNTFNEKVAGSYRFDATHEDSANVSVWEDYETARRKLNEIIERYV